MKIIITLLSTILSTYSFSQNSLGLEMGVNIISGSSMTGEPALFIATPYEYNWNKKTSFILKPSISQNRDYFIGQTQDYDIYDFRTRINVARVSFSLERKIGKPNEGLFVSYRIGLGFGTMFGGSYLQSLPNQLSATPSVASGVRKKITNSELNLIPFELFSEFGVGLGYRINQNWSFQVLRNNMIALNDVDNGGEPIITSLRDFEFLEKVRYRTIIIGVNFKLVYHFLNKK